MSNPFRYFNSSPEVIRLVVMMYVRYPLSLRNVEDLLAERGIDISHETVRFWWNRFGPMFAAEIRKRRVAHMRAYPQWRWHLDEVFVSAPVSLTWVPTPFGDVSLPAKPSMLCSFGLKFTDWVRDVAAPLTLAYTGQKVAEIETGPGFTCTARYDKLGASPSEHAKGDAIDLVSFVLADKRRVTVEALGALVGALRMTACGYFTTVLGPGADPQHETHLHLDMLMRGGTANYRICE